MRCKNCGTELSDSDKFCLKCGTAVDATEVVNAPTVSVQPINQYPAAEAESSAPAEPAAVKAEKAPKKKGKVIGILVAVLVLAIAGVVGFFVLKEYNDPSNKVIRVLDDESSDIDAVADAFADVDVVEDEHIEALKNRLDKAYADFKAGSNTYEAVNKEIDGIRKIAADKGITALDEKIAATSKQVEALNDSRANFETALAFQEKGNYDEAIKEYRKVISEDSNYQTALTNIDTCSGLFRQETIAKAEEYATSGDYDNALSVLNAALATLENDAEIKKQISVYTAEHKDHLVSQAIKDADEAVRNGDYPAAIKGLETLLESVDSSEAEQKLSRYRVDYEAECVEKIDELLADKKFDEAEKLAKDALKVLEDNEALNNKLTEIEEKRPVSLSTLTPINGGWTWNEGTPTDPFGNTYTNANNFRVFNARDYTEYYAEYRVYGEYQTLSGSLAPYADIPEDGWGRISVYADEKLVYTSPDVLRKTDTFDFSADISGADYVKIIVTVDDVSSYNEDCMILMNCQLWKD